MKSRTIFNSLNIVKLIDSIHYQLAYSNIDTSNSTWRFFNAKAELAS